MANNYYKLSEFDLLPESFGMYAWYVVARESLPAKDYYAFHKSRAYRGSIRSHLKEEYESTFSAQNNLDIEKMDGKVLEALSFEFSPPIYIGIAAKQTLRVRLIQHKTKLMQLLNGGNIDPTERSSLSIRIKQLIDEKELELNELSFIVKAIPVHSSQANEIRSVEKFLNRTHHPLMGRK